MIFDHLGKVRRVCRRAKANKANSPPSPLLSKRKTIQTYLMEIINVTAQNSADSVAKTLVGVGCIPWANASLKA